MEASLGLQLLPYRIQTAQFHLQCTVLVLFSALHNIHVAHIGFVSSLQTKSLSPQVNDAGQSWSTKGAIRVQKGCRSFGNTTTSGVLAQMQHPTTSCKAMPTDSSQTCGRSGCSCHCTTSCQRGQSPILSRKPSSGCMEVQTNSGGQSANSGLCGKCRPHLRHPRSRPRAWRRCPLMTG